GVRLATGGAIGRNSDLSRNRSQLHPAASRGASRLGWIVCDFFEPLACGTARRRTHCALVERALASLDWLDGAPGADRAGIQESLADRLVGVGEHSAGAAIPAYTSGVLRAAVRSGARGAGGRAVVGFDLVLHACGRVGTRGCRPPSVSSGP